MKSDLKITYAIINKESLFIKLSINLNDVLI